MLSAAVAAVLACSVSINSAAAQSRSLYERLGGYDSIIAVVDETIKNVAADRRINKFFAGANIPRLRRMLADQICVGAGGPCVYAGRDMRSAHAGMGIRSRHFNALVQDLGKALNKFKVPAREQRELVALLAPTKKDIVER
jgi:hemoglobin